MSSLVRKGEIYHHSFNKYGRRAHAVTGATLSPTSDRDRTLNETEENTCPSEAYILMEEDTINKQK